MPAPQIHLFHGDDAYALAEARKKLEATVVDPAWAAFNLTNLGAEASVSQAIAAVTTLPFGMGGRLVVVKEPAYLAGKSEDPAVAELEAVIERGLPPGAHLLFIVSKADSRLKLVKAIAAHGAIREFGAAKSWQVAEQVGPWVEQQAHARARKIEREAVGLLLQATGGDKNRLMQELDKLAIGSAGGPITAALVRELVRSGDVEVFAFTDAMARRDAAGALGALGKLLVTDHALKVLAAAATIMRNWTKLKKLQERGLNPQAIARETGAKSDFKVRKDLESLRGWKADQLEAALDALLEVDLAVKEGKWPPDAHPVLFERAVAKMLG